MKLVGLLDSARATKLNGVLPRKAATNKPIQGFGLNYIIDFLEFIQLEHSASQVYRSSPYRFKQSTLRMLNWCVQKGLVQRREDWGNNYRKFENNKIKNPRVYYLITDKGRQLLGLIR